MGDVFSDIISLRTKLKQHIDAHPSVTDVNGLNNTITIVIERLNIIENKIDEILGDIKKLEIPVVVSGHNIATTEVEKAKKELLNIELDEKEFIPDVDISKSKTRVKNVGTKKTKVGTDHSAFDQVLGKK